MDIQAFVQHQERDRKPFLMDDPEVDGLVSTLSQSQSFLVYKLPSWQFEMFASVSDDQSHPSATNTSSGAGESPGAL